MNLTQSVAYSFLALLANVPPALAVDTSVPVGVIGALDQEIDAIKSLMDHPQATTQNNRSVYTGSIVGHPVVLVKSGVGKVNAAATTQMLITAYGVKEALFTGVAGGVNPNTHVGDVVIGRRLVQHDYGMVTPQQQLTWRPGELPFKAVPLNTLFFDMDRSKLYKGVVSAAQHVHFDAVPAVLSKGATHSPTIISGIIATGDEFIASEAKRHWLQSTFHADATEMEGAAFAQVCAVNHIDCVVIRTVSDLANENAHTDFQALSAYAAKNSAALVQAFFAAH